MRRLTAILLTAVLLLVPFAAMAAVTDDLNALGALPEGYESKAEEPVLRGEFAFMLANVMGSGVSAKEDTAFADVKQDNEYSGYIRYLAELGIIHGTEGGSFNPEAALDMNAAAKMLVCAVGLGYAAETRGGYPEGYTYVAQRIGLYKDMSAVSGVLTKGNAAIMLHNALLAEVNDGTGETEGRLLCDMLGISAYKGMITDVNAADNSASFRVDQNLYDENPSRLTAGQTYKLGCIGTLNVCDYEQIPATVWVNSEEEIVHVITKGDINVIYGYVLSVNGDTSETGAYPAGSIRKLMFINDDEVYSAGSSVTVKYNNAYTSAPVKLCGKFAKAVVLDGRVTFIESFDIREGGLITEVTERKIVYTQGEKESLTLNDVDLIDNVRVFINGKSADIRDIRVGTVFDYYKTSDELVIVSSEKVLYDRLNSWSAGSYITVGSMDCAIRGDLYSSADGTGFTANTKVDSLLGQYVKLYIAPNGYAKYVTGDGEEADSRKFYGIVTAVRKNKGLAGTADVKLYKVIGSAVEEDMLQVTSKTKLETTSPVTTGVDNIYTALSATAGDKDNGLCVYIFRINDNKEILTISSPEYFYGTDSAGSNSITTFRDETTGQISTPTTTIRFGSSTPIVYLTEVDGELLAGTTKWASLQARSGGNMKAQFFGAGKTADPEWVFLYGDLNGFTSTSRVYYGLYTGHTQAVDADGELCRRIRILSSRGTSTYDVTEAEARALDQSTGGAGLISFTDDISGPATKVILKDTYLKLSADHDYWLSDNAAATMPLRSGTIEKVAGNRIYFTDGSAYYTNYYAQYNFFVSVNEHPRGERFETMNQSELEPGDLVYYQLSSATAGVINLLVKVEG